MHKSLKYNFIFQQMNILVVYVMEIFLVNAIVMTNHTENTGVM